MTEREEVIALLLDSGAVRFGDFTLASGAKSDVYIDIKKACTDPVRLARIAEALGRRVGNTERFAGMELGAVPLLVALSLGTGRSYSIVRKASKGHGTNQRIEGDFPAGTRVLVVEDVTTSGGSVVETIELLRNAGARVDRVLAVVDREAGASARLGGMGVSLEPLVTLGELRGAVV